MPNKELLRQLEMEKQRRGMASGGAGSDFGGTKGLSSQENRYAWEYELEAYRKSRKRERWLAAGAFCGILSVGLELAFHWGAIAGLAAGWFAK